MVSNLKCCPKCQSNEGYYVKQSVKGKIIFRQNFDGSEADNGDMYDHLEHTYISKYAFCLNCKEKIFRIE